MYRQHCCVYFAHFNYSLGPSWFRHCIGTALCYSFSGLWWKLSTDSNIDTGGLRVDNIVISPNIWRALFIIRQIPERVFQYIKRFKWMAVKLLDTADAISFKKKNELNPQEQYWTSIGPTPVGLFHTVLLWKLSSVRLYIDGWGGGI